MKQETLTIQPGQFALAELRAVWGGAVHRELRAEVPSYDCDRLFAPDIERAKQLMPQGRLGTCCQTPFTDLYSA